MWTVNDSFESFSGSAFNVPRFVYMVFFFKTKNKKQSLSKKQILFLENF